jgi:hypothetical protein
VWYTSSIFSSKKRLTLQNIKSFDIFLSVSLSIVIDTIQNKNLLEWLIKTIIPVAPTTPTNPPPLAVFSRKQSIHG